MLAAEGATVVLAARREGELVRVADGIRQRGGAAIPVVTDLTGAESITRLLATPQAEAGPVDVLVNNAGYAVWKPLEETALAEWDHTFAVNVRAAACLCAAVLPGMQARRFGRIINIGSEAGVAVVPGLAAYCVSKQALVVLTEVIQDGNHDNGIKAWVICPGFVDTAMGSVVPGANPAHFPTVEEVVDMARYLLRTGDSVKLGPQILLRTMRNPMGASTKGDRHDRHRRVACAGAGRDRPHRRWRTGRSLACRYPVRRLGRARPGQPSGVRQLVGGRTGRRRHDRRRRLPA